MSFKFFTPSEPRSLIKSAHAHFETKMTVLATPTKHWSQKKGLDRHTRDSVIQSRAEIEHRREMVKLLSNHPNTNEKKFVFLVVNILDGSFSPVGFSKLFDTKLEVFEFAQSIGREKVKIGKTVYEVANELAEEAARIEAARITKENYIKFGYWKQGD